MKKWIIGILALVLGLVFVAFVAFQLLPNEYDVMKENWGIDLPKASEVQSLITSEVSFNGDGERFTKYLYDATVDLGQSGLKRIAPSEVEEVNDHIQYFVERTLEVRQQNRDIEKIFNEHVSKAVAGDLYYYESRNSNYDTILLLYKQQEHILYVYEWHQ